MTSVFISHSSKDKAFAKRLFLLLRKHGVDVWFDEAELKIGDFLLNKITKAISNTDYVIAIVSNNSINSEWVQKELDIAIEREIQNKEMKVLPIVIDNCKIPECLIGKVQLEFKNRDDFGIPFSKLLNSIGIKDVDSQEPVFTNVRFCSVELLNDTKNKCDSTTNTFQRPIKTIYVSWEHKNAYRGMRFTRKWYRNGILWNTKNDVWDDIWDGNTKASSVSTFIFNRKGHDVGTYTMRLYIEDEYACSGTFTVE